MNELEVNVFLTKAALFDPRMKRVDLMEQADMATAWAEMLEDVPLEAALAALRKHYRSQSTPIMPADVLALAGVDVVEDPWSSVPDVTGLVVEESKHRALAAAGVTEAEYEARKHDVAWVRATFARLELGGAS